MSSLCFAPFLLIAAFHNRGSIACSYRDSTSGRNELLQYERLRSTGYVPMSNVSQQCSYEVSQPQPVSHRGCLALRIAETCPNGFAEAPLGGTTFRVEVRGASLALCSVTDLFDGQYDVGCELPPDGCVDVRVQLGYERYQAFENMVPWDQDKLGKPWHFSQDRNGFRLPPSTELAHVHWCATSADAFATSAHAPSNREQTCHVGQWLRANSSSCLDKSSGSRECSWAGGYEWWERSWRWRTCHVAEAADSAEVRGPTLATSGLHSVDFLGPSDIGFTAECMLNALYGDNVSFNYVSTKDRGSVVQSGERPVGSAAAAFNKSAIEPWADCLGPERAWACWPSWNSALGRPNTFPNAGLSSFQPTCYGWAHGFRPGDDPPPRICSHTAPGMLKLAMTLRLILADAGVPQAPRLTHRNVLVMQAGTWDPMSVPSLRIVLQLIDEFIGAVRALRASPTTRELRLIYVGYPAHPENAKTTGVRSSWVHAAADAYLLRALDDYDLAVEVIDSLGPTWPRDGASPDSIHFLRRRFSNSRYNRRGSLKPDGLGFTNPPQTARCIGDAGWPVAMALHDQITFGRKG